MKRLPIAGLALILACSPKTELPDFTVSSPTREEQDSTECFKDSTYTFKLAAADSILTQVCRYETTYNANIDLMHLGPCEKDLVFLLVRPMASEFSNIVIYKYDSAWKILKNLKKTELSNSNFTLSD